MSAGGASTGPASLARTWLRVLRRPRSFFRRTVVPGNQGRGLVFGMAVVAVEEATRLVLVGGAAPVVGGQRVLSGVLWLAVATLLVAPVALHLLAAIQTAVLMPTVADRGAASETVQVLGYATAPSVFAGLPVPEVRVAVAAWGAVLLALGIAQVHDVRFEPAVAVSALPSALLFGYGFRGFDALATLLSRWYVI